MRLTRRSARTYDASNSKSNTVSTAMNSLRELPHYINGHLIPGGDSRWGEVFNPATATARVPLADETGKARRRRRRPSGWSDTTAAAAARDHHELAEHGKVLDDARGEVIRGMEVVEFACGIPQLLKGEYSGPDRPGVDSWSMRQPVGVCAGITPFNFPVMVPMWMFPVALACGNTSFSSPPSATRRPACSSPICWLRPGLPEGVFNVVQGDKEAVDALLDRSAVAAVSFVGSTPIAEYIYATGPPMASGCRRWAAPRTTWW
jgi:malonate-semialdehyde dehydrogenase (acetylating)/methylmalonate-semialdehyde dehydrogenase